MQYKASDSGAAFGPAPLPSRVTLEGRFVRVMPLQPDLHGLSLYEATCGPANDDLWTYMWDGPFQNYGAFEAQLTRNARSEDPLFFAIVDAESQKARGYASLMRIEPRHRVIEVAMPALVRHPHYRQLALARS